MAGGAISKAMKSLVGGIAEAEPAEKKRWADELIPRSKWRGGPCTRPGEASRADPLAWGGGDTKAALQEMKHAGRANDGPPRLPWAKLKPLSAAGPTAERYEHLEDILVSAGACHRRRLLRALDEITCRWATNQVPGTLMALEHATVLFEKDEGRR